MQLIIILVVLILINITENIPLIEKDFNLRHNLT